MSTADDDQAHGYQDGRAPESVREIIERIHRSAPLMVMDFAGAGSQALWWLHSVAGSSRTILEAVDRYSPKSLVGAVRFTPGRFTSPEVAEALALGAHTRAKLLAPGQPTFGLGLTATIATDRSKRGEHRCELAVFDAFGCSRYGLRLGKGERDRAGEEQMVSLLAIRAIADACGVLGSPLPPLLQGEELVRTLRPVGVAAALEGGLKEWVLLSPEGEITDEAPREPAILSGSFNPLHRGHLRLARAASEHLGKNVLFEMPLINADKAEIGLAEGRRRAAQFLGGSPVLLTRAPLFTDKARLLPGSTFIVGVDTAARLLEGRFYGSEAGRFEAFEELRRRGARFLVAGRQRAGRFQTLAHLDIPTEATDLFEGIPERDFREDLSSSEIRGDWPPSATGDGSDSS